MVNWKCLFGFHDWSKPTFTRTKIIKQCKRCERTKIRFIPAKVLFTATLMEIAMHGSIVGALLATGHSDWAQQYAKSWSESMKESQKP